VTARGAPRIALSNALRRRGVSEGRRWGMSARIEHGVGVTLATGFVAALHVALAACQGAWDQSEACVWLVLWT